MTRDFQHRPRGHGKVHAGKEWAKDHQVTTTFTDVSLETMSLLSGVRLLDLIPTPQNRDAQRRAKLESGPALDNPWRHYSKMPEPKYDPFAVTRSKLAELAASNHELSHEALVERTKDIAKILGDRPQY